MFTRLGDILSAAFELLAADAGLAWLRVERLGARLVALVALGLLAAVCLCAMLAGVGVLLAPRLGAGVAILTVAGAALLLSLIGAMILGAPFYSFGSARRTEERAEQAKAKLERLLPGGEPARTPEQEEQPSPERERAHASVMEAIGSLASSPEALASAAFAIVSLLGVKRSVRLARQAAGATATGLAIARTVGQIEQTARSMTRAQANGHAGGRVHADSAARSTAPASDRRT